MNILSKEEIETFCNSHSYWHRKDNVLEGNYNFNSFQAVTQAVTELMLLADLHEHHPDVSFGYDAITVSLVTHDAGSVISDKDTTFAAAFDERLKALSLLQ